MLALMSGGVATPDFVALLSPPRYFQSRKIDTSIDKMMELASRDPKDAKTQVMQLTALRHLTNESEQLKKSAKFAEHRKTIEQIALGKQAQDKLGFAQEYAGVLLAKVDGAIATPVKAPPPLREDALAWFPADATLVAVFDQRFVRGTYKPEHAGVLPHVMKMFPDPQDREMLYDKIEQTGNVRVDRVALAMVEDKKPDRGNHKLMIRFTGKANPAWLINALKSFDDNIRFEVKQSKDAKGTPITIVHEAGSRPPHFVFVGNTDLLVLSYQKPEGKHGELVKEVLAVREKKQPNATSGALKTQLAQVPDRAMALFAFHVSDEIAKGFAADLNAAPKTISAFILRAEQAIDMNVDATMHNAADAGKLTKRVLELRTKGIAAIKQAQQDPLPPGMPAGLFPMLLQVMESSQVQSKADRITARVLIPDMLIEQAPNLLFRDKGGAPPEPPPPGKEKK
jgi:hypothetical protein